MHPYTKKNKIWLDEQYQRCDNQSIYFAYQPIYGIGKGHSQPNYIDKYIRTYQNIRALSHFTFSSVLDVGSAEGFQAYVISQIFGIKAECCDLSKEACKRAKEIFKLKATPADLHNLPFKDNEFDIVTCCDTLEHVTDLQKAINELLRIAKTAVVIMVPHESKKVIKQNIKNKEIHTHVHCFDTNSFNYLQRKYGYKIKSKRTNSLILKPLSFMLEGSPSQTYKTTKYPTLFRKFTNLTASILKKFSPKLIASYLIKLDGYLSKINTNYMGIQSIIIKNGAFYSNREKVRILPRQILELTVPFHFLKNR